MDDEEVRRALAGALPREGRHRFGPEDMAKIAIALRAGATIEDSAAAAGFTSVTVRRARRNRPAFDAACKEAMLAAHKRSNRPPDRSAGAPAMKRTRYGNGKPPRFDTERRKLFLEHFAATLDAHASAEAAGVCYSTVCNHRRDDPLFAAAWIEARDLGIERLDDELARQRLAAADRLRVDGDKDVPEAAAEFDRAIRFLRSYRGQQARAAAAPAPGKWSFEESLKEVEEALAIYRLRRRREDEEEGEDEEEEGDGA